VHQLLALEENAASSHALDHTYVCWFPDTLIGASARAFAIRTGVARWGAVLFA
jgi:hypothetical protein